MKKAFTMVEIIIVIVIISLLFAAIFFLRGESTSQETQSSIFFKPSHELYKTK